MSLKSETFTRRIAGVLTPYMRRIHLWDRRGDLKAGGLYLHHFLVADPVEEPHNHPWWFLSLTLWGGYTEQVHTARGTHIEQGWPGKVVFRRASFTHNVIAARPNTWTLILTGPRKGAWAFKTAKGFIEGYTFLRSKEHAQQQHS